MDTAIVTTLGPVTTPAVFSMVSADQLPEGIPMPPTVTYTGLPEKLWLLGGGRHRATRDLRRAARFKRRAYYLAGMIIRPGRKVDVTPHFIADHLDEILKRLGEGTLLIQHRGDHFVDEDELRAICAVVRGETPVGPITKADASAGETAEPADEDTKPFKPEQPVTEPAPPEPAKEPVAPEDLPPDPKQPEGEPAGSFSGDDAGLPDGFDPLSDAPTAEPVAQAAPISVPPPAEDDLPAAEEDTERRWLPEGWQMKTKKELVALAKERGLTVDPKGPNQKIIDALAAWLQGK